ncbi:MAG: hypothetical protein D6812_07855 [Deltaproteobacteria bacterium]|nr:MAG: hypothetical protein D6812_07855 [Deltaproteobacteria bacterium]
MKKTGSKQQLRRIIHLLIVRLLPSLARMPEVSDLRERVSWGRAVRFAIPWHPRISRSVRMDDEEGESAAVMGNASPTVPRMLPEVDLKMLPEVDLKMLPEVDLKMLPALSPTSAMLDIARRRMLPPAMARC